MPELCSSLEKINEYVYYNKQDVLTLKKDSLEELKRLAMTTKRKTIRLCAHNNESADVHEMIIVHTRGRFIRPHKHPFKSVSYLVLEGDADFVMYDDAGQVLGTRALSGSNLEQSFYLRISQSFYYMPIVKSDFFVFLEVIPGPFKPENTVYASWAPEPENHIEVEAFLKKTYKDLECVVN